MMTKIKEWIGVVAALVIGVLMFMLRGQKKLTEQAKSALASTTFKLTTQENDKEYEEAKNRADRLVAAYKSARVSSDHPDYRKPE